MLRKYIWEARNNLLSLFCFFFSLLFCDCNYCSIVTLNHSYKNHVIWLIINFKDIIIFCDNYIVVKLLMAAQRKWKKKHCKCTVVHKFVRRWLYSEREARTCLAYLENEYEFFFFNSFVCYFNTVANENLIWLHLY